jgi:hypothetical protein
MEGFQLACGFCYECADLPVAGVEAEGDGRAVFGAKAAVSAEDEDFGVEETVWVPAHAGVLTEAEEIAGGLGEEHLRCDGKPAGWAGRMGCDGAQVEVGAFENGGERDFLNGEGS